MSGTSVDGIDAVLADLRDSPPRLLRGITRAWPTDLRAQLLALNLPLDQELHRAAVLDNAVARQSARAVQALLAEAAVSSSRITAIGSHGQTVRHAPASDDPYTIQLGNPSLLSELTGITVVADFRRRDLAAGGQGAPLAPAFHAAFFRSHDEDRAVVNIGGIANLSLLPADPTAVVTGFDTGPGNGLLDSWAAQQLGTPMDRDGGWAASGQVRSELLERWLADPYFRQAAPKSTGREYFNPSWPGDVSAYRPADVQASLTALTAITIADALGQQAPTTRRLLVCGGGVHNPTLLQRLGAQLPGLAIQSTATLGIDPDYLEALGFAWLAHRTLSGQPGNLPTVTGARGPRILGGIYPA